jgi:ribosome biogenesis GTPase
MHQQSALAVGDRVQVREEDDGELWVTGVLPRRTSLSRPDPRNPQQKRVIAANIDTVVIVVAMRKPGLKPGLIDRYLLAVGKGGARPVLCVNKIDLAVGEDVLQGDLRETLMDDEEWQLLEPYRSLGIAIFPVSAKLGVGLEPLLEELGGDTCVLVGHSGVGKSSLLNAFHPQLELATQEVRDDDGTGRHTTTRSVLYLLEGETQIIDTPGIRELGLWDLNPEDLSDAFPDLAEHAAACRFANCTHTHEPACGVKAALEGDDLPQARYDAYLRILESLEAS